MIVFALLQQPGASSGASAVGHYGGGASGSTAGQTALAGHFFRFLFSVVPQWVQIAGVVIGVPVAIIVVWQLWTRRRAIWSWWLSRHAPARFAIVFALFAIAVGATISGLAGYNYMMHNNDFCQSCHIMDTAWNRFQVSAHKKIQCHACHRQPLYVSSVELFWWVTERRMEVPPHDKVPSAVCDECHMQHASDSTLSNVALTAGHAVHLRSDSAALKDVQCVTCHGKDFHIFVPNTSTCAQSGCHTKTRVNLGAMSRQSFAHCTICHDFKSRVPLSVTVAQAKTKLVPEVTNCFTCHQMTQKTLAFDLTKDPHKGNCGICHDPHKQEKPNDAFKTCAASRCHGSPDTLTAFHRGLGGHVMNQCGACHEAHSWRVKGRDCLSCHRSINRDIPLRRASSLGMPTLHRAPARLDHRRVAGRIRVASMPRTITAAWHRSPPAAAAPADSFRHSVHASLACTTCHGTTETHGGLKFSAPEGCLACHHSERQRVECTGCHARTALVSRPMPMAFAISARPQTVTREILFEHSRHGRLACTACHGSDVRRAVKTTCASCHADHHTNAANCASCHPTARVGHDRLAHEGCARCHNDPTVVALSATRPVCLACHEAQRNHYPSGDCATCHALTDIDRSRPARSGGGR